MCIRKLLGTRPMYDTRASDIGTVCDGCARVSVEPSCSRTSFRIRSRHASGLRSASANGPAVGCACSSCATEVAAEAVQRRVQQPAVLHQVDGRVERVAAAATGVLPAGDMRGQVAPQLGDAADQPVVTQVTQTQADARVTAQVGVKPARRGEVHLARAAAPGPAAAGRRGVPGVDQSGLQSGADQLVLGLLQFEVELRLSEPGHRKTGSATPGMTS